MKGVKAPKIMGLLRVKIIRGLNLAKRDLRGSDPYVILSMAHQVFFVQFFYFLVQFLFDADDNFLCSFLEKESRFFVVLRSSVCLPYLCFPVSIVSLSNYFFWSSSSPSLMRYRSHASQRISGFSAIFSKVTLALLYLSLPPSLPPCLSLICRNCIFLSCSARVAKRERETEIKIEREREAVERKKVIGERKREIENRESQGGRKIER